MILSIPMTLSSRMRICHQSYILVLRLLMADPEKLNRRLRYAIKRVMFYASKYILANYLIEARGMKYVAILQACRWRRRIQTR